MQPRIPIDQDRIAELCRKHHIRRLAPFGSVLREDFRPDSDIDVLYEFEPGYLVRFFELFDMEEELSRLFEGQRVEMVKPKYLSPWIRDRVLAQSQVQFDGEG